MSDGLSDWHNHQVFTGLTMDRPDAYGHCTRGGAGVTYEELEARGMTIREYEESRPWYPGPKTPGCRLCDTARRECTGCILMRLARERDQARMGIIDTAEALKRTLRDLDEARAGVALAAALLRRCKGYIPTWEGGLWAGVTEWLEQQLADATDAERGGGG